MAFKGPGLILEGSTQRAVPDNVNTKRNLADQSTARIDQQIYSFNVNQPRNTYYP